MLPFFLGSKKEEHSKIEYLSLVVTGGKLNEPLHLLFQFWN